MLGEMIYTSVGGSEKRLVQYKPSSGNNPITLNIDKDTDFVILCGQTQAQSSTLNGSGISWTYVNPLYGQYGGWYYYGTLHAGDTLVIQGMTSGGVATVSAFLVE